MFTVCRFIGHTKQTRHSCQFLFSANALNITSGELFALLISLRNGNSIITSDMINLHNAFAAHVIDKVL